MLGVSQWRHGAFCVSWQHRVRRRLPRPWNRVYHRWITDNFPCNRHINTTSGSKSSPGKIFYRNSSGARTPTSNSAWTTKEKTSTRNLGAEITSLSGPFSLSTAKATPTRDRGTGDWNQRHCDRFILSKTQTDFLVCRFPRRYIDQSLFQLCITARRIIIFRRTLFFVFVFFSKSGRRNAKAKIIKMEEEKKEQRRDLYDDIRGWSPIQFVAPTDKA